MLRPVRSRSRTTALPRSRLSRGMPPKPGISPRRSSGKQKRAILSATIRSHVSASSNPPPNVTPWTAAMVVSGAASIAFITRWMRSRKSRTPREPRPPAARGLRFAIELAQIGAGAKAFLARARNDQRVRLVLRAVQARRRIARVRRAWPSRFRCKARGRARVRSRRPQRARKASCRENLFMRASSGTSRSISAAKRAAIASRLSLPFAVSRPFSMRERLR